MTRNVTLRLDEELLRRTRVLAAHQGTSVSQVVTRLLEERLCSEEDYERVRRRAVARMKTPPTWRWVKPASRDDLHER